MTSIAKLVGVAASILTIAVVFLLAPMIGGSFENSGPTLATDTAATGILTFSGNVTTGELVNITAGGVVYSFEFNTTGTGVTAGCINVDVSGGYNDSVNASGNLTDAINNNATLAGLITAANTTNTTTITADVIGETANGYATTETGAETAWGSATMTGGVTGSAWDSASNTNLPTGADFWTDNATFITIVVIAIMAGLIINVFTKMQKP